MNGMERRDAEAQGGSVAQLQPLQLLQLQLM